MNNTAYVVGYVPVRDNTNTPRFGVFGEATPTAGICVQWTQLEVKGADFETALNEAIRMMDRDHRFVRSVLSTTTRPCWRVATHDEFVESIKAEQERAA